MMRVSLKQPWGQWSKGHIFPDMPGGQARGLIERNIAEEVAEQSENKQFSAPVNRMMSSEPRTSKKSG